MCLFMVCLVWVKLNFIIVIGILKVELNYLLLICSCLMVDLLGEWMNWLKFELILFGISLLVLLC